MPSLDVSQHRTSLEGQPQRVSCLSPLPLRRRHSKNESLGPVAELGLHSSVFCCWDKEHNHSDMGESMYFCCTSRSQSVTGFKQELEAEAMEDCCSQTRSQASTKIDFFFFFQMQFFI